MNRTWYSEQMLKKIAAVSALFVSTTLATSAKADDTFNQPGDHPKYSVEVEPHLIVGWYRSVGVGARVNFPLMDNGPISTVNNNLAIGVGAELMYLGYTQRWRGVYYREGGVFLSVPVALQWNFFVAKHWSVFPELGLALNHGFYDCGPGNNCSSLYIDLVAAIGARYHFNEKTAFTFRLGYPGLTLGLSFF